VHMTHQVIARTTAKTEFILGLVSLLTEAIGIEQFGHVQADVAEVITTLEMLRAFGRAAQADAGPNEYGVFTPAWAPLNAARRNQLIHRLLRSAGGERRTALRRLCFAHVGIANREKVAVPDWLARSGYGRSRS